MAIAPTPLVVLHAFWTLYMVNSFQFTRSASFILAHRRHTEKKPQDRAFRASPVFSSVSFRVPKNLPCNPPSHTLGLITRTTRF